MIPCGDYLKHDGGVSFQISEQHSRKLFTFRGSTQEIQPSCESGGATFTATWEWGTPTFRLQPDGVTLIEDGVHEFRLQQHPAPTTASTEQLCAFRDIGYLVMHTAVDDARIRAALLCDDVQAVVRRVCERQEVGAWVEGCSQASAVVRRTPHSDSGGASRVQLMPLPACPGSSASRTPSGRRCARCSATTCRCRRRRRWPSRRAACPTAASPPLLPVSPAAHPSVAALDELRPHRRHCDTSWRTAYLPFSSRVRARRRRAAWRRRPGRSRPTRTSTACTRPATACRRASCTTLRVRRRTRTRARGALGRGGAGLACDPPPVHVLARPSAVLVGVSLTDTPAPNMGNLGVFPGSHRAVARAVGRAGAPAAVATLSSADAAAGGATARLSRLVGDLRGLAPPQPLCVLAGAATLAHYQLVHYVQPNALGVTPRVAVYFRVTAPRRGGAARTCPEALTPCGLFSEMPGLARLPD